MQMTHCKLQELKESLRNIPEAVLQSIAGEDVGGSSKEERSFVKPLAEAVDFADIEELAPEVVIPKSPYRKPYIVTPVGPLLDATGGNRTSQMRDITNSTSTITLDPEAEVKKVFPWFEKNKILCFSKLFSPSSTGVEEMATTRQRRFRPAKCKTYTYRYNAYRVGSQIV